MKKAHSNPQEQGYRLFDSIEIKKEGATLQVELYLPAKGVGSLKGRLVRLMERELREKK